MDDLEAKPLTNPSGKKVQLTSCPSEDTAAAEGVITKEMLKIERQLEKKAFREEQKLLKEKMLEEDKKVEEEQCFKRLQYLLERSSVFSKYIAEQQQEISEGKENDGQKTIANNENGKRGSKRKAPNSPVEQKHATVNAKKSKIKDVLLDSVQDVPCNSHVTLDEETIRRRQPKLLTGGLMRNYQLEGFEWFKSLYENAVNGILADEMGLGKTIQSIAFIAHLISMGVTGPFFVCGPLSTVPNWYAEFKRFTPDIPVMIYHGTKEERQELARKIHKGTKINNLTCFPVVITSYQVALIDAPQLRSIKWKMLVIDEAHRIKNFQCKLICSLKQYKSSHRLLLTGTPLQNNLAELWSLLNFILPEIFNDLEVFQTWFDISRLSQSGANQEILQKQQEKQLVTLIHQILTPFLLRRTKQDVELNLPTKKEIVLFAPMSKLQKKYYEMTLNNTIEDYFRPKEKLDLGSKRLKKPVISSNFTFKSAESSITEDMSLKEDSVLNLNTRNESMCLRQICCHPYIISYPLSYTGEYRVDEDIVKVSGKLQVLDVLLPELQNRSHKVLIFSQFVKMIDILADYCDFRNYKFTRLDGSMSLSMRQDEICGFNEDSSIFIFLISTRAGGLGINLAKADTVIIYDSDWNPQNDLQAQDRCHRIGQTKPVIVYRLLIPNTVDERINSFAVNKRKLEKVIMQKGRFTTNDTLNKKQDVVTNEELLEILESSDVNSYIKTDENYVLSPRELERILDRSDLASEKSQSGLEEM